MASAFHSSSRCLLFIARKTSCSRSFGTSRKVPLYYRTLSFCKIPSVRSPLLQRHQNVIFCLNNPARTCTTKTVDPTSVASSVSQQNVASSTGAGFSLPDTSKIDPVSVLPSSVDEKYIPDPPSIPTFNTADVLQATGEPSFASQGLGGWTPIGLVENALEFMHIGLDIPWWLSIVIGTCIIRIAMFPIFIMSQRNMVKMNNKLPQMQMLQMKLSEARRTGNHLLAAKSAQDLMLFMKENKINPLKNMIAPLSQAPVFISFFFALREMANLPLESLSTGGMFWFSNLIVPDPYYILPLITSATVFITIELGTEGAIPSQQMYLARYFLRAVPLIIFPFTINFPAAILCYWVTNNFISLGFVALLRVKSVNAFLKIGQKVRHEQENLPLKPKGFVEGFNDALTNMKIAKNLEERTRVDEVRFRRSGLGAVQKTYPYDPTRQRSSSTTTVSAKQRSEK